MCRLCCYQDEFRYVQLYIEYLRIYDLLRQWKIHGGNICQLCGYQDELWYVH